MKTELAHGGKLRLEDSRIHAGTLFVLCPELDLPLDLLCETIHFISVEASYSQLF